MTGERQLSGVVVERFVELWIRGKLQERIFLARRPGFHLGDCAVDVIGRESREDAALFIEQRKLARLVAAWLAEHGRLFGLFKEIVNDAIEEQRGRFANRLLFFADVNFGLNAEAFGAQRARASKGRSDREACHTVKMTKYVNRHGSLHGR